MTARTIPLGARRAAKGNAVPARSKPCPRLRLLACALGLAVAAGAAGLLWRAPHCRPFPPHQHYAVPGAAICRWEPDHDAAAPPTAGEGT